MFGGAHPLIVGIEVDLQKARAALRASEGGDVEVRPSAGVAAMTAGMHNGPMRLLPLEANRFVRGRGKFYSTIERDGA